MEKRGTDEKRRRRDWRQSVLLTAGVPLGPFRLPFAAQAPLHVRQRVAVGRQHLAQQRYVRDGQPERVDLAQPFLVRERRHVTAELVERRVDAAKHQRFRVINGRFATVVEFRPFFFVSSPAPPGRKSS